MAFCRAITKRLIDGYRQVSKTKIICHYMTSSNLQDRIGVGIESVAPPPGVKGLTVSETKKLLKVYQMEKLRARLREIPKSSVSYLEFVQICRESCGNNDEQGFQMAKSLDHSGCVVVLGDIVFLHPHQIAKTMETMINQTSAIPNDPRKEELVQLEITKKYIDMKARRIVKAELYCGLVFLVAQTLGFMRLTFWELSWDVMEPICFFLTSLYFLSGYCFFLRTSTEPSFEGFYQQRFKAKQKKLMDSHGFDFLRYSQLKSMFTPVTL